MRLTSFILPFSLATFIRFWLIHSDYKEEIAERIEVSTPINSWHRILESIFRMKIGVDPYSSDVLHETPLHLLFYKFVIDNLGQYLPLAFIFCDIATAVTLYLFAKKYMFTLFIDQEMNKNLYAKNAEDQILKTADFRDIPMYVALMYLFNPYVIFNCVGMTTTTFLNLWLALFFYGISYGSILLSSVSYVLSATQAFYPLILISPLYLSVWKRKQCIFKAVMAVTLSILLLILFMYGCYYIMGNWDFLQHSYGFILSVDDQKPNIGVYWYFFMEMFEHFRQLFIYSYQINVTLLYFLPLTLKFRKDPILLAMCFTTLSTVFKSYPSIGDFGFILALLPCWKYMYNCMQQIFVSGVAIIIITTLAPVLWDLWIYWGSANANFYFGTTLAFITAHIFILTDISFAYTKREYLLKYGSKRKINGQSAKLILE